MAKAKTDGKMIANNKKAYHDYFILDTYEAGYFPGRDGSEIPPDGEVQHQEAFIPH